MIMIGVWDDDKFLYTFRLDHIKIVISIPTSVVYTSLMG